MAFLEILRTRACRAPGKRSQSALLRSIHSKSWRLEDLPLTDAQLGTLEEVEADLECLEADAADAEREAARTVPEREA